jgi:hypothetical protein
MTLINHSRKSEEVELGHGFEWACKSRGEVLKERWLRDGGRKGYRESEHFEYTVHQSGTIMVHVSDGLRIEYSF